MSRFSIKASTKYGRQIVMKKIFVFALSVGLISGIGGCSSLFPPTQPPETNVLELTGSISSLNLTRTDSSQESDIAVEGCTCTFGPLIVTAYGGDTSDIHFSFIEPLTDVIRPHTLQAEIFPSVLKNSGIDSAWVAILYYDQSAGGGVLYDTIRAYANY